MVVSTTFQQPVIQRREIRNLALVGFMGVGKSVIGRRVAQLLDFEYLDTDGWIESQEGRSISRIFAEEGEAHFRNLEHQATLTLEQRSNLVISTGGGLILNPDNLESLKKHAIVICLWASPERIWQRVRHQSHRPLLETENPRQRISEMLIAREPFYRKADVLVNTEFRTIKEVTRQVIGHFNLARKNHVSFKNPRPLITKSS